MKITREELTRLLAEKVMGWKLRDNGSIDPSGFDECDVTDDKVYVKKEGEHYWFACKYSDWNPLEDANHRDMLLEALGFITMQVGHNQYGNRVVTIRRRSEKPHYERHTSANYVHHTGIGKTINEAVCLAVAEAVTGIKYEMEN